MHLAAKGTKYIGSIREGRVKGEGGCVGDERRNIKSLTSYLHDKLDTNTDVSQGHRKHI